MDMRPVSMLTFDMDPVCRTLPGPGEAVEGAGAAPPPGGPVERMNSENSARDSRASLGSLAWGPVVARVLDGIGGIDRGTTPPCLLELVGRFLLM